MQDIIHTASPLFLLYVAAFSIITLLLLIIKLRIHAFIALVLVSFLVAVLTGIPSEEIVPTLTDSFGSTLASVALLVGLGAMIGKLLEVSGGAQVLADELIGKFGKEKAPLALGIASLIFGFPIFFDAGLIVMMPVILSVAKRFGGSILIYALPAAGAFAVMHAFVPPHPGPVAAAGFLGADMGLLLLVGLLVIAPTWYIGAYLFGVYSGKKFNISLANLLASSELTSQPDKPPKFGTVMLLLLLPMVLIFLDTGLNTLITAGVIDGMDPLTKVLRMIGKTPVALLITLLVCLLVFSKDYEMKELDRLCSESLAPICGVILITGAGGMYGGVLRASGIGDALTQLLTNTGMPIIVAAFVISSCLRVAQGSATVALTTTAALISPMVVATTALSELDLCFIVIAIAGGATVLSHFNDSGFWLVSRLFKMDEKTTLRTWTVMETLLGSIAFLIVLVLSWIF